MECKLSFQIFSYLADEIRNKCVHFACISLFIKIFMTNYNSSLMAINKIK